MFSVKTSSKNIFTKNLPSNLGVFSTLYLYMLTIVPVLILIELDPVGSLDIKFTSASNGFSNSIPYVQLQPLTYNILGNWRYQPHLMSSVFD